MGVEVFDACALVAFIRDESGADLVESLLNDPSSECHVHAINLLEVYYQMIRMTDEATAGRVVDDLLSLGLTVGEDLDRAFSRSVGRLKARGKISLADCFCISLAIRLGGRVVTSDHHEFDPLVPLGLCPILFIR